MYWKEKWPETAYMLLFAGSTMMLFGGLILLYLNARSEGPLEQWVLEGNSLLTEQELVAGLDLEPGLYIDEDFKNSMQYQLQKHPYVNEAKVTYDAGLLHIQIKEHVCVFTMKTKDSLIDIGMQLNPITNESRCVNVPVLSGDLPDAPELSEKATLVRFFEEWQSATRKFPGLADRISEIHFERTGGITMYMVHRQLRVLMPELPGRMAFEKLSATMYYIEKERTPARVIDLRGPDALILAGN